MKGSKFINKCSRKEYEMIGSQKRMLEELEVNSTDAES